MKEVRLPQERRRRLPFYLAMEEWVASHLPAEDWFFAWRVGPTVICGRNQDMPLEVNLPYCRRRGIDVVRRRSGGGCVYADMNNYMFSFIAPGGDVEANYARYTSMTAAMLSSLGLDVSVSGRNDILASGSKIAGNAFYRLADRSIVHGTMLFDVDAESMANALTPSRAKLESKAVASAPRRVTCLRSLGVTMPVEEFGAYAVGYLTKGEYITLSDADVAEIETLEQRYYDAEYLYGRIRSGVPGLVRRFRRFEGVGEFYAEMALNEDRTKIERLLLSGDFFADGDVESEIERPLSGTVLDELQRAVESLDTGKTVRGLKPEMLLELLDVNTER